MRLIFKSFPNVADKVKQSLRCMGLALCMGGIALPYGTSTAQETKALDQNIVIAQMIMNFPLVTSWPASHAVQENKIVLCSISDNPIVRDIAAMVTASKAAQHFTLQKNITTETVHQCHILIVADQDMNQWAHLYSIIKDLPVLTVGTDKNFLRKGGMIGFLLAEKNLGVFSEQNIRFEVSLKRTQSVGLTLDPMLLELAEHIVTD